jgi:osmotically-inducible protein OsmY
VHAGLRTYGEVRSYGELHRGQRSWADLGVYSVRAGESGITERQPASFRGRGPKGYKRSDERLMEAICERLTDDPGVDASDVSVEVSDGEVTLTGTVLDKPTKWQVEDVVESCSGVIGIRNCLRSRIPAR